MACPLAACGIGPLPIVGGTWPWRHQHVSPAEAMLAIGALVCPNKADMATKTGRASPLKESAT